MHKRQQESAAYINALLKNSRMPRNQVAAISGLSNAYIRVLENGDSASVGREKLIAFAVALNLDLNKIDDLLTIFDRAKLTTDDIPIFLETSKHRKISSALHPLRDVYAIELVFLSVEQIPGHQVTVNDMPSAVFRPEGYRTFTDKKLAEGHSIYSDLIEAIGRERSRNLVVQLARYPVDHYICRDNLEGYIKQCDDIEGKGWRVKHIETMLWHIRNYDKYRLFLTNLIPSFNFVLKLPPESGKYTDKLSFMGKQIDFFLGPRSGRLAGFATDNQIVIENFKAEVESLKANIIEEYLDRRRLETYLEDLIA